MVIIGGTGSGKTTLISQVLMARRHVLSLVTKPDDSSKNLPNDKPRNRHLKSVDEIGNRPDETRFVIEPSMQSQQRELLKAYRRAIKDKGWCVYTDELFYAEQELGLGKVIRLLMTQARSMGVTLVNGVQRPVLVNRFALSEPTHVLVGSVEGRDLLTVLDATTPRLKATILSMDRFEFSWYYRPTKQWAVVDLDRIMPGNGGQNEGENEAENAREQDDAGTLSRIGR